jgi:hypothetical protein
MYAYEKTDHLVIPENFSTCLHEYLAHICFNTDKLLPNNPYQRPIRRQDVLALDFITPITRSEIFSNKNLLLHKILNSIYEQDLLLLDGSFNSEQSYQEFQAFYTPEFVDLGKAIKPTLEYLAFDFLEDAIEVMGIWSKEKFCDYIAALINHYEAAPSLLCEALQSMAYPHLAAQMLLIQMAPDFLTEASAMGRALLGSFGEEQSELTKVFIDEYGYGVHEAKHSTLFEDTLSSAGLNSQVHNYYDDYLPTALMLGNYFHYLCSNRGSHFKHLGALYYSEAVIPHFNRQISQTLKTIIPAINTRYFDEHVHIDKHHQRMILDKIILPSIAKYGEGIIEDILFGLESFRILLGLADDDLIAQIKFINQLKSHNNIDLGQYKKTDAPCTFTEMQGEITTAHIHQKDEHFMVNDGSLIFHATSLNPIVLNAGQDMIIPKGRVHSMIIQSVTSHYTVQSIEPIRR